MYSIILDWIRIAYIWYSCILSPFHFVSFAFCYNCIMSHLHFVLYAFCHICILCHCNMSHLHFATFALCLICILSYLHFWRFAFCCFFCILSNLHFVWIPTGKFQRNKIELHLKKKLLVYMRSSQKRFCTCLHPQK